MVFVVDMPISIVFSFRSNERCAPPHTQRAPEHLETTSHAQSGGALDCRRVFHPARELRHGLLSPGCTDLAQAKEGDNVALGTDLSLCVGSDDRDLACHGRRRRSKRGMRGIRGFREPVPFIVSMYMYMYMYIYL